MTKQLLADDSIDCRIYLIRGQKVMLDRDLAELYSVETKILNKAVSRNLDRFPSDFMFELSDEEHRALRFQFGTLKKGQHSKYSPRVFTEQGVAMLSSILRAKRAVQVNIEIMRAFVRLRRLMASHGALGKRLDDLERKYDGQFHEVFEDIRKLMVPPGKETKRIGFQL